MKNTKKNLIKFFCLILTSILTLTPSVVSAKTLIEFNKNKNNETKNFENVKNNKKIENLQLLNKNIVNEECSVPCAYWLYPGQYQEAKNYVSEEVWNKGFWIVNEYIAGNRNNYLTVFYSKFGNRNFDINIVFNQIYATKNTMDYYDSFLRGYYYWDLLYSEYYRLFNIIYYSFMSSWYWDFNGNYFYELQCAFMAGYSW